MRGPLLTVAAPGRTLGSILLLILLLPAVRAHGEARPRLVCDPVSLLELRVRLEARPPIIAEEDWVAIESLHRTYVEALAPVYQEPAGLFAETVEQLFTKLAACPCEQRSIGTLIERSEWFTAQLAAADAKLLAAVGERIDAKQDDLRAFADARSAQRATVAMCSIRWGEALDLSAPLRIRSARLLTEADREAIEPLLREAEARAAAIAAKLLAADTALQRACADAIDADGLDCSVPGDADECSARCAAIAAERPESSQLRMKLKAAMLRLQLAVLPRVSFDAQRELRADIAENLSAPCPIERRGIERRFRLALCSTRITEADRTALHAAYRAWAAEDDQIVDRFYSRALRGETITVNTEERERAHVRRSELAGRTLRGGFPALPEVLTRRLDAAWLDDPFDGRPLEARDSANDLALFRRAGSVVTDARANASALRANWKAGPMTGSNVQQWLANPTAAEIAMVAKVIEDAAPAWSALPGTPRPADIEQLDDAVIADVARMLGPGHRDAVARAGLERALNVWAANESLAGHAADFEVLPNLAALVRTHAPVQARDALDVILIEEQGALVAAARARKEGLEREALAGAEHAAAAIALENRAQADAEFQQAWAIGRHTICRTSTNEFRRVLERMLQALPEEQRTAFRARYERAAFPLLHAFDVNSFAPFAHQAVALPTLTQASKLELATATDMWSSHADNALIAMSDALRSQPPRSTLETLRLLVALDHYRFRSAQRDAHAIAALRRLLAPSEIAAIPGLGEYEKLAIRAAWNHPVD